MLRDHNPVKIPGSVSQTGAVKIFDTLKRAAFVFAWSCFIPARLLLAFVRYCWAKSQVRQIMCLTFLSNARLEWITCAVCILKSDPGEELSNIIYSSLLRQSNPRLLLRSSSKRSQHVVKRRWNVSDGTVIYFPTRRTGRNSNQQVFMLTAARYCLFSR